MYRQLPDTELAILVSKGSAVAFRELYERYWDTLLQMAYQQIGDQYIAEEIVQDVFLGLWERRHEHIIQQVRHYLAKAVKFAVFKHILREKRRKELLSSNFSPHSIQDDEAFLEARFLEEFIDRVVDSLPEKCRDVFQKSRYEGLAIPEIACQLGVAQKTVEGHLTKALKTIRLSLKSLLPNLMIAAIYFFH
ncbi:RNA polymerase sigma-70 factor [Parapedobacter defluvii]|nr:RNA polymerase sigma-70 factor [Parapedobacter defluvii]